MEFYLTLPSNSSMDYYPDNTVANYVTHLPRNIQLEGVWEVSVVEVFYPCSFLTLDDSSVIFITTYLESEYAALTIINASLDEEDKNLTYMYQNWLCVN